MKHSLAALLMFNTVLSYVTFRCVRNMTCCKVYGMICDVVVYGHNGQFSICCYLLPNERNVGQSARERTCLLCLHAMNIYVTGIAAMVNIHVFIAIG